MPQSGWAENQNRESKAIKMKNQELLKLQSTQYHR